MAIQAGQQLLHYRLIEKIGEGGMGVVWRARDTKLDREVAVKVLPDHVARDSARLARFEREAKAVAALNHPNIVTLHSVERDRDVRFITMELVRGKPLRERIKESGLDVREILQIARPLVDALGKAHAQGITHRDLKPDNVMIDEDGRVKILDFGLAKVAGAPEAAETTDAPTATTTGAGVVLGTAYYMSPEQAQGKPADERSDIFSVGVMLYEMATGERPFQGDNPMSILSSIIKDEAPSLTEVKAVHPRQLGRIVRRCLEKDPERRFQKARGLGAELDHLAEELGRGTAAAGPAPASRRFVLAVGALVLLAAAVAVVLLRGVGAVPADDAPAMQLASLAVIPFVNDGGGEENEYFSDGMTAELINALGRVPGLRVPARTTVFTLKGQDLTVQQVGERLRVDHVLEGSVRKAGNRLKISAQLVQAGDEFVVWSDSYERDLEDVFAIQADIAQSIVSKLEVQLMGRGEKPLVQRSTDDFEAYNLFLRGRYHWEKRTESELFESIRHFEQAIARDPDYAEAHMGLAWAYLYLSSYYLPPLEVMPKAKAAAQRAIELDGTLASAHAALGNIHFYYDWDWEAARERARRALELDPNSPDAHELHGVLLASQGEVDEAVDELLRAEELDPLSASRKWPVGVGLLMARQYDLAMQVARRGLELDERNPLLHAIIALIAPLIGDYELAIRHAERALELEESAMTIELVLYNYAAAGLLDKARAGIPRMLAKVEERYTCPYEVATVYVAIEEIDEALGWFEKAIQARADCWAWGNVDPRMDAMREDERYREMLRRVGHRIDDR